MPTTWRVHFPLGSSRSTSATPLLVEPVPGLVERIPAIPRGVETSLGKVAVVADKDVELYAVAGMNEGIVYS